MNNDHWLDWLRHWFVKHPIKTPPEFMRTDYTREVMGRIRTSPKQAPAFQIFPVPRLSFGLATAAACLLLAVVLINQAPNQPNSRPGALTVPVEVNWELLAEVDEAPPLNGWIQLEDELQELDRIMLAEAISAPKDGASIDELLDLLDELDDDGSILLGDDLSFSGDLLKELEEFDEAELAIG